MMNWNVFRQALATLAPKILKLTPLAPIADAVESAIVAVGAMTDGQGVPLPGPDRLANAVQITADAITFTNRQAGQLLIDPHINPDTLALIIGATYDAAKFAHDLAIDHADALAVLNRDPLVGGRATGIAPSSSPAIADAFDRGLAKQSSTEPGSSADDAPTPRKPHASSRRSGHS